MISVCLQNFGSLVLHLVLAQTVVLVGRCGHRPLFIGWQNQQSKAQNNSSCYVMGTLSYKGDQS